VILWHAGLAVLTVYVTLGRRRIDYRFVLLGAVFPDVLDGLLSVFSFGGPAGRSVGHSLLAVVIVSVAIIVVTSGTRRLALFGVGVGWLLHLVGDGMWQAPLTFFWPAFGLRFSASPGEPYSLDLVVHPVSHLSTWGGEVLGAMILAWFYVAFELHDRARLRLFLRDGYLRP
jgi:inner membrane protein